LLIRWKCPVCRRSFSQYPPFAVPFKRFTHETIKSLCLAYLETPGVTYRSAVRDDGMEIAYPECHPHCDSIEDDDAATAVLSHTALYRWISSIGDLATLKPASSDASPPNLESAKYRSATREQTLLQCRNVLNQSDGRDAPVETISVHPRVGNRKAEFPE
jgi:hypothetical protein